MLQTPHCARCGYANAMTWTRCRCCGRPMVECARHRRHRMSLHRRRARHLRHVFRRRASAPTLTDEDLAAIIAAW
jgi:hypothetical protein